MMEPITDKVSLDLFALKYFSEQGGRFCRPMGRSKDTLEGGWQKKPYSLREINAHVRDGNNAGLLTGKLSNNIGSLDLDRKYQAFCEKFPHYAKFPTVYRPDAEDRGKIFFIVEDTPQNIGQLKSAKYKPFGEKHPWFEFLWTGRYAIVPPSQHPDTEAEYHLKNADQSIPKITAKEIDSIWHWLTSDHLLRQLDSKKKSSPSSDTAKEEIRSRFDLEDYAKANFGSDAKEQRNGEVRILGNGGLLIKGSEWFCHSDGIGGDCFDLAGYKLFGNRWDRTNAEMFVKALHEAATFTGVELAQRKNGDSEASTNGDGNHAITEGSEPEPTHHLRLTDLGNARRLVNLFGENIRYVNEWGRWYVWDGTRWALDKTGAIDRLAKKVPLVIYQEALQASDEMRPKIIKWGATSESAGKISAMIELARTEAGVAIEHEQLDAQPYLLNCRNGTIDLTNGKLLPHAHADLITKRLEIDYNPDATCPLWLKFLDRVMSGNQEMISFLQRAVGYTLTGDVSEQCLFFKHGGGKNGKTVFSETLKGLFGDYGQKAPTDMLMIKYGGSGIPNDVARLPGARFVLAAEIEEGRRLAESQVKDLTGGDTIVARFMREEYFEFLPTHKLWLYGNHKPEIRGTDDGIWRRIRLIPFTVTIPQEERDPQLVKKLRTELSGILAWAVQGCLEWQDKGLQVPEAVEKATDSYRVEMDVISEFLGDRCVLYAHAKIKAGELYDVYCRWCEDNSERALSRRAFGQRLRERGFTSDKLSTHVFWFGIGLTTGLEVGNQERETTEI